MAAVEGIGDQQFIFIWYMRAKKKKKKIKPGLDHDLLDQIKFQLQGFYLGLQIPS